MLVFLRRARALFSKNKLLTGILVGSFLISLVYSFHFRIHPVVDAQAYDQIAINLLHGCGFREDCSKSFNYDTAIVRAGPAYEFFLAGVYYVFGHYYEVVWIWQALLHMATAFLVYAIARRLFAEEGRQVGLVAAAFIGFHPDLIEIGAMLMTETLYLFLAVLVLWLFVWMYEKPERFGRSTLLAFGVGIAILSRPPVMLFVPVILLVYFFKKKWCQALIFVTVLGATLTPWIIRNYQVFHEIIPTTLIGEYNVWVGNTTQSDGGQISGGFNPVTTYGDTYGYAGLKQEAPRQFWQFVGQHPAGFIKLLLVRTVRYFSLIRPMGFWFYQTGTGQLVFVACSTLAIAALFVGGFAGLVLLLREKKQLYYYVVALALTAPLVLIPTVVQSRYRFQIYPFLALFAGYFVAVYLKNKQHVRSALFLVVAFFGLVTIIDIFSFWNVIVGHLNSLF